MYSARITRHNPTAFIFLIDRSGSMEEKIKFGSHTTTKAEAVAIVTNMLVKELINRCRREEGIVDYFDIAAIGYSSGHATMLLGGKDSFAKPSILAMQRCSQRSFSRERVLPNGHVVVTTDELKYWIEPKAEGNTPMCSAMEQALHLVRKWCKQTTNKVSYPPTIFNITDGEASDGDYQTLIRIADEIKQQHTDDGHTLLFNINLSSSVEDKPVIFPGSKDDLPCCRYAEMLYEMSSQMPEEYNETIRHISNCHCEPPYRGMSFNTPIADMIAMMNIGSISINKI